MRNRFGPVKASVPPIGQGTWQLEHHHRSQVVAALGRGLELGLAHVDTAEMYGDGSVEEMVGEAIEGRRDEVFLVSKVLPSNASRRGTVTACERSLRRLRTDRLDCYLLHWPSSEHPLEDTIAAFEDLQRSGAIRSYGVSNFDEDLLRKAVAIAGRGKIACDQVLYHLEERHAEAGLIPLCEELGIAFVGYSPFGSGSFPSPQSRGGKALAEIARAHGATPRQVALAFLTRRPSLFTIPRSSRVEHTEENAGALRLKLSEAELARIDAAFPVRRRRELPTL
ncbi:MAG: aldo/keto reductase [Deltaproteobacteria bacterium]|nr:MAG: aldo/keto reductase [Deltaproteobacteria bacterium]